jgi:hypothetical protein
MPAQLLVAVGVEARDGQRESDLPDRCPARFTVPDRAVHPLDVAVCRDNSPPGCCLILQTPGALPDGARSRPTLVLAPRADKVPPSQIMSKRMGPEKGVFGSGAALRPGCRSPSGANRWRHDRARSRAWAARTPVPSSCRPCRPGGSRQTGLCGQCRQTGRACLRRSEARRCRCEPQVRAATEADGIALALLALRLVAFHVRQPGDAMALQASGQRRACQGRERRLKGAKAIIQGQERINGGMQRSSPSGGHSNQGRSRPRPASVRVVERGSFGPVFKFSTVARLRHVAPVFGVMPSSRRSAAGEACDHSGRPSDRWRADPRHCSSGGAPSPWSLGPMAFPWPDRGASGTNLAHEASFPSQERIAPSNPGIEQLGQS